MYKNAVIPAVEPGARLLNKSCKSYCMLDSRFTVRSLRCPGMTQKGFTLIELLVVVLIIGILSAVALPQYQKAVGKSRVAEAKLALSTLQKASYVAYLETGEHPTIDSLSVSLPLSKNWDYFIDECCVGNGTFGCSWEADDKRSGSGFIRLVDQSYNMACGDTADLQTPYAGYMCFSDTPNYCPTMGFSKYDANIDGFKEP